MDIASPSSEEQPVQDQNVQWENSYFRRLWIKLTNKPESKKTRCS